MNKIVLTFIALILLIAGSVYFFTAKESDKTTQKADSGNFVELPSTMKKKALFSLYADPINSPDTAFINEKGEEKRLSDFRGKTLLLNFWATWCLPCREEMPELDKLQADMGGDDFQVLILSVDRGGLAASRAFLDKINIKHLDLYFDKRGTLARQMKAIGYPTTVLVRPDGKQYGFLLGPANWSSEEAKTLIKSIMNTSK